MPIFGLFWPETRDSTSYWGLGPGSLLKSPSDDTILLSSGFIRKVSCRRHIIIGGKVSIPLCVRPELIECDDCPDWFM